MAINRVLVVAGISGLTGLIALKLSEQENRAKLAGIVGKTVSNLTLGFPVAAIGALAILKEAGFKQEILENLLKEEGGYEKLIEIVMNVITAAQIETKSSETEQADETSQATAEVSPEIKQLFEQALSNFQYFTNDVSQQNQGFSLDKLKRLRDEFLSSETQLQSETKLQTEKPAVAEEQIKTVETPKKGFSINFKISFGD